jgi:hypothetical protein
MSLFRKSQCPRTKVHLDCSPETVACALAVNECLYMETAMLELGPPQESCRPGPLSHVTLTLRPLCVIL